MPRLLSFFQRMRLKLYKYEERAGGFSCRSCRFFEKKEGQGYCSNHLIGAPVSPDGCCTLWDGSSRFKA